MCPGLRYPCLLQMVKVSLEVLFGRVFEAIPGGFEGLCVSGIKVLLCLKRALVCRLVMLNGASGSCLCCLSVVRKPSRPPPWWVPHVGSKRFEPPHGIPRNLPEPPHGGLGMGLIWER